MTLERRRGRAYSYAMEFLTRRPIKQTPTEAAPAGWSDVLALSKVQIEAGETVPLENFLDRLRASIVRMKAKQERQAAPKA